MSQLILPEPQIPNHAIVPSGFGPARTEHGGIFINVSDLKLFRACPQKYFLRRVLGLEKARPEDYFTVGGLYGAGSGEWLRTGDLAAASLAIDAEIAQRVPNRETMLPDEKEIVDRMVYITKHWTRAFSEFYIDHHRDFRVIQNEWVIAISLGPHCLAMAIDSVIERDAGYGFREGKTTKLKDTAKFIENFLLDDQIFGYSYGFQRVTGAPMPYTILDVLTKPGTHNPFGIGWERFRAADPDFFRTDLYPQQKNVDLWAVQAENTATLIASLLDQDPDGSKGMWGRYFEECFGMFQSQRCSFFDWCLHEQPGDWRHRQLDYVDRPSLISEGKKFAAPEPVNVN